jgi:5-formyltetrahydrofolate cyclo-ligase
VERIAREPTPRGAGMDVAPTVQDDAVHAERSVLRAAITCERRRISRVEHRTAARRLRDVFLELPQLRTARRVGLYVSRSTAPGTGLLRDTLIARGVTAVSPSIDSRDSFRWRALPGSHLLRRAPVHRGRPSAGRSGGSAVPIVLVPALAVDTRGRWLSNDRCDEYDQILRTLDSDTLVLAVVHDNELFDEAVEPVPALPSDVRVDGALTPSRVRFFTDRHQLLGDRLPPAAGPARSGGDDVRRQGARRGEPPTRPWSRPGWPDPLSAARAREGHGEGLGEDHEVRP